MDSEAYDRLRERVDRAADELQRLRSENAQLAESLRVLWAKTADGPSEGAAVQLDGDREELKQKVAGFIDIIDRALGELTVKENA